MYREFLDNVRILGVPLKFLKIKKILEGQEPAQQFYNKAFGRYNAVVEDGLNTSTQKQMQFAQLLQLRELGVPIPDETLLDSSTLQNKKQLIEAVSQQKQQQQQMQQMQMQSQMAEADARTKLAQARTVADQGLGIERISRVQENQALAQERKAQAVKDEEIGLLNLVKALKEIETIDLGHLEQLIRIANTIKTQPEKTSSMMPETNINPQGVSPEIPQPAISS